MDDRLVDDRPAKKAKLEEPEPATTVPAKSAAQVDVKHDPFSFSGEGGLFGSLVGTLGKRASEEPEVGITEYVDPDIPPFSGIIKHRFTDFLVFEVGMDGQVIRLKDTKSPAKPVAPVVEGTAQTDGGGAPSEAEPLWNEKSEEAAKLIIPAAQLDAFKDFIVAGPDPPITRGGGANATQPRRIFTTEIIEAKEARTAFHRGLRAAFNGKMNSETCELTPGGDQLINVTWLKSGQKPRVSKGLPTAFDPQDLD
ncbi:hypothetical protein P7C70_g9326, partial [Phenoliferia sp. Uapishka_3]